MCGCIQNEEGERIVFCRHCAASLSQTVEDDRGRLQLNPEWLQARAGFATGSKVTDITKTIYKKGSTEAGKDRAWSAKRGHYADHVLAERLTRAPQGIREIYSLRERRDLEPEARSAYALFRRKQTAKLEKVVEVGFIHHLFIEGFGCSPDGLCGDEGMIEIKCLDASTHLRLCEGDESVIEEYKPQLRAGLSCTNRNWIDFVSYCPPLFQENMDLCVYRFQRSEDEISQLECAVKQFLAEVDDRVRSLRERARSGFIFLDREARQDDLTTQLAESIELVRKPNAAHARKGKIIQLVK
jgi:YqaJ-like recombinase protein